MFSFFKLLLIIWHLWARFIVPSAYGFHIKCEMTPVKQGFIGQAKTIFSSFKNPLLILIVLKNWSSSSNNIFIFINLFFSLNLLFRSWGVCDTLLQTGKYCAHYFLKIKKPSLLSNIWITSWVIYSSLIIEIEKP